MRNDLPPRLLVVDDDLGVIAAYRLVLEKSNDHAPVQKMFGLDDLEAELFGSLQVEKPEWRVTFVDQGLDAVTAVKWAIKNGDPFTAIFLDVRMPPGIDGHETAARIRRIDPNVHIVVVTGYSDYTIEDFIEVAGPERLISYMPKPVWPDELRKVARNLMDKKHHRVLLNPQRLISSE
ncbi:MAG: response regulator [Hyphomicrobium sp.]